MKVWIIKFNRINQCSYTDICIQFFFDFSDKGLFRCFSLLNLTAREFPSVLEFSISSLRGKNFIIFSNYCCYYTYSLHHVSPFCFFYFYLCLLHQSLTI